MDFGHLDGRFDVDFKLIVISTLRLITRNIRKMSNKLADIFQTKRHVFRRRAMIQFELVEIAYEDELGHFLCRQMKDVILDLLKCLGEVFSLRLHLDDEFLRQKIIDKAIIPHFFRAFMLELATVIKRILYAKYG